MTLTNTELQQLRDKHHDDIIRVLVRGACYTTVDGGVFHVIKVDKGSRKGEFLSGRRPAQALIIFLSAPLGFREGVPRWMQGIHLDRLEITRIT